MLLNKNIKILINYLFGPLVFILLLVSIYHQLHERNGWQASFHQFRHAIADTNNRYKLALVFLLMIGNWGLEARKWQLSMRPVQRLSWWRSFQATLTGSTIASFTPNRTGEYLGRMLFLEESSRISSVSLTILCSLSQNIMTMGMGCAGILYFLGHLSALPKADGENLRLWLQVLLFLVGALMAAATVFYFRLSWLRIVLKALRLPDKYLVYVKILEDVDTNILFIILVLSLFRYSIFILQYGLMFSVCGVNLNLSQTFGSMSVVFLVMAIIPTFTLLTELGLRWEVSLQLVQLFSDRAMGILACSFGIWLVNLVIPAFVGGLLILRVKLFRNK
jgi:uncharacterized membrane protein YbhN (UPF0104 family)